MLTIVTPYRRKTLFLSIQLCITLFFCHAQVNNASAVLVSDTVETSTKTKGTLYDRFEKLKIPLIKKDNQKRLWLLPALAWNNYDKTQVGLMIGANRVNSYHILAMPLYGTGSKNITGIFNSEFFLPLKSTTLKASFGVDFKRFSYLLFPEDLTYNKLSPFIKVTPSTNFKGDLSLYFRHHSLWQEYVLQGRKTQYFQLNSLGAKHLLENNKVGIRSKANFMIGKQFATFSLQTDLVLKYQKKKGNGFYLNAFAGTFLYNNKMNTNIDAPLPIFQLSGSTNNGIYWLQKDFAFNDFYLDRNGIDPFFRRQQATSEGGFRSLTSVGNSNSFLFAVNLKSDILLPYKVKRIVNLQPFFNIASSKNRNAKAEIYAEGGLSIGFWDEVLSFHIPFATTKNIQLNQSTAYGIEKGAWAKRVTFSIDFMKLKRKFTSTSSHKGFDS